jgi:hypothetical protein
VKPGVLEFPGNPVRPTRDTTQSREYFSKKVSRSNDGNGSKREQAKGLSLITCGSSEPDMTAEKFEFEVSERPSAILITIPPTTAHHVLPLQHVPNLDSFHLENTSDGLPAPAISTILDDHGAGKAKVAFGRQEEVQSDGRWSGECLGCVGLYELG